MAQVTATHVAHPARGEELGLLGNLLVVGAPQLVGLQLLGKEVRRPVARPGGQGRARAARRGASGARRRLAASAASQDQGSRAQTRYHCSTHPALLRSPTVASYPLGKRPEERGRPRPPCGDRGLPVTDRKSTRLNSSHV